MARQRRDARPGGCPGARQRLTSHAGQPRRTTRIPGHATSTVRRCLGESSVLDLDPIVKAYDIRGVVTEQLTTEVAERLGRAAAVELHGEAIVVGRDMRPSGVDLSEAFMAGVRAQGVDTVDLGLASTDLLYYASGRLGLPGAM